jgi:16S rRNA (uracil1498-N3)-methyltransferase
VPLGKEQAHYLLTVLRLGDGAEALVFNGRDGEFGATLHQTRRQEIGSLT